MLCHSLQFMSIKKISAKKFTNISTENEQTTAIKQNANCVKNVWISY